MKRMLTQVQANNVAGEECSSSSRPTVDARAGGEPPMPPGEVWQADSPGTTTGNTTAA